MRCLVLGARRYNFKDDVGEQVRFTKLHYLIEDASEGIPDEDQVGEPPFEVVGPLELFDSLSPGRGFYDVEFRQTPGRRGRPTLQPVAATYEGPASFVVDGPALVQD